MVSEFDYVINLDIVVFSGYKLIFGIGFFFYDVIDKVVDNNKDVNYVIVDDVIKGKDNVVSVVFVDNELVYLVGIVVVKIIKIKIVGFVGGMEFEVIICFEKGFEVGVKLVDKLIKIKVDYVGLFGDVVKGKIIVVV